MNQTKHGKRSAALSAVRRSSKSSVNSDISTSSTKSNDKVKNGVNHEKNERKSAKSTPEKPKPITEMNESNEVLESKENGKNSKTALENSTETSNVSPKKVQNESENSVVKVDEKSQVMVEVLLEDTTESMPPLQLLETDEIEPELVSISAESPSDRESDGSKFNVSPSLSRSATRRSQVRNVPTPKTPKLVVSNGNGECYDVVEIDETETLDDKLSQRVTVDLEKLNKSKNGNNGESTPVEDPIEIGFETESNDISEISNNELPVTPVPVIASTSTTSLGTLSSMDSPMSTPTPMATPPIVLPSLGLSIKSIDNSSVLGNYSGDNTNRNIDFTLRDASSGPQDEITTPYDDKPSFVSQTKDLSFVKTMRVISGRKNLRDLRQKSLERRLKDSSVNYSTSSRSFSERYKRKNDSFDYESPKRMKNMENELENSGLLSYVSSPLDNLRKRFARTQVTSTPVQQSSHSEPANFVAEDYNNYVVGEEQQDAKPQDTKKWCSIQ